MSSDSDNTPAYSNNGPRDPDRDRLRDLVYGSMSAEFASVGDGKPATFPITPFYDPEHETVVVSSPPAFSGKLENVRSDSRVSLLLRDAGGEYLVTGDARIRESDPEANAEYVRDLIESEPATPKRKAHEQSLDFLDSWIGQVLMGWYALRVVVEIESASMSHVSDVTSIEELPSWQAVGMERAEASRYDRAVITVVGDDGYPIIQPITDVRIHGRASVIEPVPTPVLYDSQPACLLLHWHDDAIEHLGQRVVFGRFRTDDEPPRFVPGSSTTFRRDGVFDTLRFIINGKWQTRAYLRG